MPIELLDISISRAKPEVKKPAFKPRVFEDGSVEILLERGVRMRQKPQTCLSCGAQRFSGPFGVEAVRASMAGLCIGCFRAEEIARAGAIEAERRDRLANGTLDAGRRRYLAHVLATPIWRDRQKIKNIYEESARLSLETGIPHEVDHIYPIQSKFACGLHVHHNLQIIEKTRNRSKGNLFPLHDSPCGVGIV